MDRRPAVIVFARAPRPGATKTRLIPALGPDRAAALYQCFLLDVLSTVSTLDAHIIAAAAEPQDALEITALASRVCPQAEVTVQAGADLGGRIAAAVEQALAQGHRPAIVLGSDAPTLPAGLIARAIELAGRHDVVLGPCFDGGYYLIGLRAPADSLLADIRWSTGDVLRQTVDRAGSLGLSVALLEPWYDVDTPEDLRLLREHLGREVAGERPLACPRTWDYLCDLPESDVE
jgi:rSAM/selenodomain-associated transferase 1